MVVSSVVNRRFEVDVFVVRNVVEERLLGRNRKRCDGRASFSVGVKVSYGIHDVASDGDESKSPVDIDLTAVRQSPPRHHSVFLEPDQRTEVFAEFDFVLRGANSTSVVVPQLFEVHAAVREKFGNFVERPIPLLQVYERSVPRFVDEGGFELCVGDVPKPPVNRNVVDRDPRVRVRLDEAFLEVDVVFSVFEPSRNFFHFFSK